MNIYLETNAWYEHCDADDVGMPPRDDFFDWTHMAVVWQNIVPNPGPERTNGLKVNIKYRQFCSSQKPVLPPKLPHRVNRPEENLPETNWGKFCPKMEISNYSSYLLNRA